MPSLHEVDSPGQSFTCMSNYYVLYREFSFTYTLRLVNYSSAILVIRTQNNIIY